MSYKWTGGGNYALITNHTLSIGLGEILEATACSVWDLLASGFNFNNFTDRFISHFRSKSTGTTSNSSYSAYSTGDALKTNGVYIAKNTFLGIALNTPYFTINSQKRSGTPSESNKNTGGFIEAKLGWPPVNAGARVTWTETEKGTVTSTYSMKADNPIDIKFATGNSAVDLTSAGGISDTTVNAKALSLKNPNSSGGDIAVTYNPIGTGALNIATRNQNTTVNANGAVNLTTDEGDGKNSKNITLNATEDITCKHNGLIDTLNLNSSKGKIDFKIDNYTVSSSETGGTTEENPIRKSLNLTALKDININSVYPGDLIIGKIESKTGNVTIYTEGNLVSAVTERQNPTTSTQIENWKNAGILDTWTQKELVNSLNAKVFSKNPYDVDLAYTANIIANRAILDIGGNIGSKGTATTISYSNLNNEDNLKLLANARVGDLEWGSNSVTYTPHTPIGVTLRDNTSRWNLDLKGTADDDINLAAADDQTIFNIKYKSGAGSYKLGNNNADVTLITAKGISIPDTRIYAKNLTLRGGNGNVNLIANHADYIDIITGGNISFSLGGKEGQSIMYIRNAIAGGKVDLTGYVTDFYRADDNAYISAGSGENIYITAKSLGNNFDKNTIGILANGANLMYNVNSSSTPIYLQAITRDGLQNKIYLRTLSETGRVGIERSRKVYFSPDNAFESSYFTY